MEDEYSYCPLLQTLVNSYQLEVHQQPPGLLFSTQQLQCHVVKYDRKQQRYPNSVPVPGTLHLRSQPRVTLLLVS